jgi:hypothetical protein
MSSTNTLSNKTSTTTVIAKLDAVDKFLGEWIECPDYLREKLGTAVKDLLHENSQIDKKDLEKLTDQVVANAYKLVPAVCSKMYAMDLTLQLTQFTKVYDLLDKLSKM